MSTANKSQTLLAAAKAEHDAAARGWAETLKAYEDAVNRRGGYPGDPDTTWKAHLKAQTVMDKADTKYTRILQAIKLGKVLI
jgi:hypothetical protein